MFAIKSSMEKRIKKFWIAGFFLPTINATVFRLWFEIRKNWESWKILKFGNPENPNPKSRDSRPIFRINTENPEFSGNS